MGSGDCVIGLNPSVDTVDSIGSVLRHLDKLRRETNAPTQICVLSHLKTQLACLERGAPVEIMFQSLAGTDRTLVEEFDVTVELLDQAHDAMSKNGPLREFAEHCMYFETGQRLFGSCVNQSHDYLIDGWLQPSLRPSRSCNPDRELVER